MGDIEDIYKEESEDLDSSFLDELKNGGNKESVIKKFLQNSAKSRQKYHRKYEKDFSKERWEFLHKKKKSGKKVKFDHLEVKHFGFKSGFFEEIKMKFDVFCFRGKRFLLNQWGKYMPKWSFYYYYKIKKDILESFRDTCEDGERTFSSFGNWIMKGVDSIKEYFNKTYLKMTRIFSAICKALLFWRKKNINKKVVEKGVLKETKSNSEVGSNESKT